MLAKLWKKVLLAICIIACLFNIMSKLVSRTSLELNLKSVENGESIFSIFKEKEQEKESDTIDGVVNIETTQTNETQKTENSKTEGINPTDFVVIY